MRISDWSSDVCSSDLLDHRRVPAPGLVQRLRPFRPERALQPGGRLAGLALRSLAAVAVPLSLSVRMRLQPAAGHDAAEAQVHGERAEEQARHQAQADGYRTLSRPVAPDPSPSTAAPGAHGDPTDWEKWRSSVKIGGLP